MGVMILPHAEANVPNSLLWTGVACDSTRAFCENATATRNEKATRFEQVARLDGRYRNGWKPAAASLSNRNNLKLF